MKLAAILAAGILLQQTPTFRSQANVTAIDVTVTDKNGNVVRSLGPDDFIVTARKQPRKVLTADFIALKPAAARGAVLPESTLVPSAASSNRTADRGRVFILAIETSMIRIGEGRVQMRQVSEFLDHLAPDDLVGLVSLPTFTPRVELTRNRAEIREALDSVVGSYAGYRSCSYTYGEAAAISAGDAKLAAAAMQDRLGPPPRVCIGGTDNVRVVVPEYRIHTRSMLDSLGSLADALKEVPGLKTIVLVADGIFADRENHDDISRLAARTEAAGTRVYALHLESPPAEASSKGNVTSTHHLDDNYGFAAMAEVAAATGGTAFRVSGSAIPSLDRIEEEASGYYVLGIDVDPADRPGQEIALSVKTRRPGLDVRARRTFTTRAVPPARPRATADGDAIATAQLLQSPISAGEIPLDVDTVSSYAPASQITQRVVIVADIASPAGEISAIGFHVATAAGRSIAYKIESPVALTDDSGAPYLVALDLEPGAYRLRLACVRTNGTRGSVERLFTVKRAVDRNALSDILFGADNTLPWKPIAAPAAGLKRLGVRVELAPSAAEADASSVKLLVGRAGRDTWMGQANLTMTGDGARRIASGAIDADQLAPGAYVLKVELWRNGTLAASTAKQFTIR
jgi:VWFA-related protein